MTRYSDRMTSFVRSFVLFLLGSLFLMSWFIYVCLTLPIFVYRWSLSTLIAPYFRPHLGNIVSVSASLVATDFLSRNIHTSSRNGVVVNMILEGTLSLDEIKQKIWERWITGVDDKNGQLLYPEFQQYIEYWMGFMYWKQDKQFTLENHVKLHKLGENESEEDCEQFVRDLVETLMNQLFIPKRSPWEIHVLHQYRNNTLHEGPLTMLLMRLHHAMADGPSFLTVVGEGLFDAKVANMEVALRNPSEEASRKISVCSRLVEYLQLPLRLSHDMGYSTLFYFRQNNPWLLGDRKKRWHQYYGRSNLIPVDKIKCIKNRFGVSFTTVLLSGVVAGIAECLKRTQKSIPQNMIVAIPFPLRKRSTKLGVFKSTAIVVDVPVSSHLESTERLLTCQHLLESTRNSTFSMMVPIFQNILASHLAPIARFLVYNRLFPTYLTSFPGPAADVRWHQRNKLVGGDFAVGGLLGNAGVSFMALSVKNHLRIAVTAEEALMPDEQETSQLVVFIEKEIDELYKIACNKDFVICAS